MIKLNLLPPEEKKLIVLEKINRKIIVNGLLVLAILVFFAFLLFLIWFFISNQINLSKINLTAVQAQLKSEGLEDFENQIKEVNNKIEKLSTIQNEYKYYSLALEKIISLIPQEVYLNNLSINQTETGLKTIIRGFAPNRDQIITLKQNLKKSDIFHDIKSPLSNLLKPTDIDFFFEFIIKN